jgi:MEMO1 family protein
MTVLQVRPPAVAGRFYPADPKVLARDVDSCVTRAGGQLPDLPGGPGSRLAAVVAPHAGYVYSGPVVGFAYAALAREVRLRTRPIARVWLLGPAHYVPLRGGALSGADCFSTPLGDVLVDHVGEQMAEECPWVVVDDAAHAPEHSLEVQVPFVQRILPEARIVPLLVGHGDADRVGTFLARVLAEPDEFVVVSTDLSHYLDHEVARRRDAVTARHLVAREWRAIGDRDACGASALRALLAAVQRTGGLVTQLDLRNSGDTCGPLDRVVGYGAFAVTIAEETA